MSPQKTLEGRVRSILEPDRNRSSVSKASLAAGVVAGVLTVVPLSMLQAEASSNETPLETSPIGDETPEKTDSSSTDPETKPQAPVASNKTESAAEGSGSADGNENTENKAGSATGRKPSRFLDSICPITN